MILFKNATLMEIDPPRMREGMDVLVAGDEIKAVGQGLEAGDPASGSSSGADKRDSEPRIIDATGKLLFPGLVCSHHHYYSGLARGIIAELGPMPDFVSVLKQLWWRMDRAHDEQSLYTSSLICSLDAIRCGTTAVIDHHASPSFITGSLTALKRAMEETGLRGASCYEVTDRHGEQGMAEGIEENRSFARSIDESKENGTWSGLSEAYVGGHAPFTIPDAGLEQLAQVAEETGRGVHVHLAEGSYDVSHSHITYGKDLVPRLDEFGLVNEKSILVHGIYLSSEEIALMNERDAFLVHNCRSNMNNNVGYNDRLREYRNLALGTDGIGGDMFEEMKVAFFKHRDAGGPLQPGDFLAALASGYRLLERSYGRRFGRLEEGYVADLVLADYASPTPLLPENIAGHIAFGMSSNIVESVMIGGRMVMEERKFPLDAPAIYAGAREEAKRLWSRMNEIEP
jgi:putative selenium metabolism protein SsnA